MRKRKEHPVPARRAALAAFDRGVESVTGRRQPWRGSEMVTAASVRPGRRIDVLIRSSRRLGVPLKEYAAVAAKWSIHNDPDSRLDLDALTRAGVYDAVKRHLAMSRAERFKHSRRPGDGVMDQLSRLREVFKRIRPQDRVPVLVAMRTELDPAILLSIPQVRELWAVRPKGFVPGVLYAEALLPSRKARAWPSWWNAFLEEVSGPCPQPDAVRSKGEGLRESTASA